MALFVLIPSDGSGVGTFQPAEHDRVRVWRLPKIS